MLDQSIEFFKSAFAFPGLAWQLILIGITLGLAFGACWLALYHPPLFSQRTLWPVGVVSAFLTWAAISFIQIPLQSWTGKFLLLFWSQRTLTDWILLAGIPQILLSGLVQEGAKLVPVALIWLKYSRKLSLKSGLIFGAIAGAGFGIFEAVWTHNSIFASGWTWQTFETSGFNALLGFWERFFTTGFHIAVSALAGYGLARGMGWQFYLFASLIHGLTNYSVILMQNLLLNAYQLEIYITILTLLLTGFVLYLRWQKVKLA